MKKMNNKGGALVECVIALVVIAIISASAIATIDYTSSIVRKSEAKLRATLMTENIVECFYGSKTMTSFTTMLTNMELTQDQTETNQYSATISEEYSVSVTVTVDATNNTMTVDVSGVDDTTGGTYKK